MPLFSYRAVSASGSVSSGELEAANESEIVDRLRDQGLMPMQIAQALGAAQAPGVRGKAVAGARWFQPRRVTRDHVLSITRELATLLRAGLPLDRALELLISLAPTLPVAVTAAGHPRRGARRQGAVAGARCAPRHLLALLREHRARGGGGRRARHGPAAPGRDDGSQQGAARVGALRADLPDDPRGRGRDVGDDPARVRRAAVPVDVRAGGQGAADPDADRDRRRDVPAEVVVGDDSGDRAVRPLVPPPRTQSRGAPRARFAPAAHAAAGRPDREDRGRAFRAHAVDADRQRSDAARGARHCQGHDGQCRAVGSARGRHREAARRARVSGARSRKRASIRGSRRR